MSEESTEKAFRLFPNPVSKDRSVYIKSSLGEAPILLTLFDSLGKIVIQKQIQSEAPSFDTSGLQKGVYHYWLYTSNKTTFQTGTLIIL